MPLWANIVFVILFFMVLGVIIGIPVISIILIVYLIKKNKKKKH